MLRRVGPEELYRGLDQGEPAGYAHPSYIQTLAEFGRPIHLPAAEAWLLARRIPGCEDADAIGAYPFFACCHYPELRAELAQLDELVSVAVVPDPFSFPDVSLLHAVFANVTPFKTHYLVDLEIGFGRYLRGHHRRYARKGLGSFDVECVAEPVEYGSEWAGLYAHLVTRHGIDGLRAFSARSLARQLAVPGCRYFRALRDGVAHGAMVCYIDRGVAYGHLISTTAVGQKLSAQYALYWTVIEHFRDHARWFLMGAVPGLSDDEDAGLNFVKAGWATATCQGYFCGQVLNPERYQTLCTRSPGAGSAFPAYRHNPLG